MTKALRLRVSKTELFYLRQLVRNNKDFKEFSDREKEIIINASIDINEWVSEREIVEYELRKRLEGADTTTERIKERIRGEIEKRRAKSQESNNNNSGKLEA